MNVFIAILSTLCFGAMLNEKDKHNKMLFGACFITTIIAMLIVTSMRVL